MAPQLLFPTMNPRFAIVVHCFVTVLHDCRSVTPGTSVVIANLETEYKLSPPPGTYTQSIAIAPARDVPELTMVPKVAGILGFRFIWYQVVRRLATTVDEK